MNRFLLWVSVVMAALLALSAAYLTYAGQSPWSAILLGVFWTWRAYHHAKVAALK